MLTTRKIFRVFMFSILTIAIIVGLYLAWYYLLRPLRTYDFALENYTRPIENPDFTYDEVLGPIDDASDAREKGVSVFIDVYGEDIIRNEKPFLVGYDQNTDTWMVVGSLSPIPLTLGGVAHIVINGSDGAVVAVWHTK